MEKFNDPFAPRLPDQPLLGAFLVASIGIGVSTQVCSSATTRTLALVLTFALEGLIFTLHLKRMASARRQGLLDLYAKYDLSPLGFLPAQSPRRLSDPRFSVWEALSRDLPRLNRRATLKQAVEALSIPSDEALESLANESSGGGAASLRRAYVLLAQLVHSYAHAHAATWHKPEEEKGSDHPVAGGQVGGGRGGAVEIPAPLAVPFTWVCARLGLPPVLTAAATDLWNFALLDDERAAARSEANAAPGARAGHRRGDNRVLPDQRPLGSGGEDSGGGGGGLSGGATGLRPELFHVERLGLLSSVTGLEAEARFHAVPTALQAQIGPLVPWLLTVPGLLAAGDEGRLAAVLEALTAVLGRMTATFLRTPSLVDRDDFYDTYRPILNGFHPAGLLLRLDPKGGPTGDDGAGGGAQASKRVTVVYPKGPSAGQSTVFILVDLILGLRHAPQTPHRNADPADPAAAAAAKDSGGGGFAGPARGAEGMRGFQREMLASYTPPAHARLAHDLARALSAVPGGRASVRHYLARSALRPPAPPPSPPSPNRGGWGRAIGRWRASARGRSSAPSSRLVAAHAGACGALADLRRAHFRVATRFLAPPTGSNSDRSNEAEPATGGATEAKGPGAPLRPGTETGTGATSFKALLAEALANTSEAARLATSTEAAADLKPKTE